MKVVSVRLFLQTIKMTLLCGELLWISQGCISDVDTYTPVKITVQDSTGKPLPGFAILVLGSTSGSLGGKPAISLEEYTVTTDATGSCQTNLHWHNQIANFSFTYTTNLAYPNATGIIKYLPPLDVTGRLTYDKVSPRSTTLIIIPVLLR